MKETEFVENYIDAHRDDMLRDWAALVNCEGRHDELENMKEVLNCLRRLYEEAGISCEVIPTADGVPAVLTGVWGTEFSGKPVIFGGHYDTVFPRGKFGENPFRVENGMAYGPGCLDMKGGVIIALYVIRALKEAGYCERPLKIVYCGDEEGGLHHGTCVAPVITKACQGALCGFNMETGPIGNELCVGRKGTVLGRFTVRGVSAHSGNNFEAGCSAIGEALYKMKAIYEMTDLAQGTNMNLGVVKGGTAWNTIPDFCEVTWSGRFARMSEMERVEKDVENVLKKTFVEGTTTTMQILGRGGVFEKTERNLALWRFVSQVSERTGQGAMGNVFLGGGSDAVQMAKAGIPVLCSCGVRGEWNHTEREYAVVESLYERAKLFANVVLEIGEFERELRTE